ncbi:MAG: hypothetical protein ABFS23_09835, partial [Pseudomonadota bacterium]
TIFATSERYTGDLVSEAQELSYSGEDGLEAADYICQYHADEADLKGTYKAVLSSSEVNANARITTSLGPYRQVTGTPVAENYAALFSTRSGASSDPELPPIQLISPVIRTELGEWWGRPGSPFLRRVWTGSNSLGENLRIGPGSSGAIIPNLTTCNDWTDDGDGTDECEMSDGGPCAISGLMTSSTVSWLREGPESCHVERRLYCAEQ